MTRRRFYAFFDILINSIFLPPITFAFIYVYFDWGYSLFKVEWYHIALISFMFAFFVFGFLFWHRIEVDVDNNICEGHYLVTKYDSYDQKNNWSFNLDQVVNAEVVRLSKKDKLKYTSSKFVFNKYIKITLKNGDIKYMYVSHFSYFQIKKMVYMIKTSKFLQEKN